MSIGHTIEEFRKKWIDYNFFWSVTRVCHHLDVLKAFLETNESKTVLHNAYYVYIWFKLLISPMNVRFHPSVTAT